MMIEGNKIVIRQQELGDEEFLHLWRNDSRTMAYSELAYGFLRSKEAFRIEVKESVESLDLFPIERTFIICKKEGLEPIGDITYRNWDKRNRNAEIGLEIAKKDERGKGYGSDALHCFLDFMFRFLNLNRIELKTLKENLVAQQLYKQFGFNTIGVAREAIFDSRTGEYSDYIYMDLLLRDWLSKKV